MSIAPNPRALVAPPSPHGGVSLAELVQLGVDPATVTDFSASTSPLGPSPRIWAAVSQVEVGRYPDDRAVELCESLSRKNGVPADCILVGNGSVELVWLLALAYLGPGDLALIVGPTFSEYERAARVAGAGIARWQADPSADFRPDVKGIGETIRRTRPRLMFLCNPNNPTGSYIPLTAVSELVGIDALGLLVLDEAYLGFLEQPEDSTAILASGKAVLLRSMTKDHGLAGFRLGYVIAPPVVVQHLRNVRPPWTVSSVAQAAAMAAISDEEHLARARAEVREAKTFLQAELRRLGLRVVPSSANFLLVEVGDAARFRMHLLRRGCCVRDCSSFGLPEYVRIGIRTRAECARLVEAIAEVLEQQYAG